MRFTQEQITEKTLALTAQGTRFTGRMLAKAFKLILAQAKKQHTKLTTPKIYKGKQTAKQLLSSGAGVTSAEITDQNIKSFEPVARKWGVDFALYKNDSVSPPMWTVLFKEKQADAMMGAFKEYSANTLKRTAEKPSVLNLLKKMKDLVKNQVVDRTKNKERGGPEL